ncbi:sigma 54-interacting transcriptional regulator [Proteiniborus sp.]|uniref:sigma-54 interaction domain-containing protein n=1 Tax=Proteiniborus sp. TaxID=2079015 RepID=UPI00332B515A
MSLYKIQDSVQEVAEAISAVLNVDVTIIDENLNRIAATGKYKRSIGEKIPKNCSFELIINSKEPLFIDTPDANEICNSCAAKGKCTELATLGYPIIRNDEILGAIGVNAFDEGQKKKIEQSYDSLVVFLNKLCDLLVGKLNYYDTIAELTIKEEETRKIINGLDDGIICIDDKERVKFANLKVQKDLKISEKDIINKSLKDILPGINIEFDNMNPQEKRINVKDEKKSFIIKSIPVVIDGKKASNILEIHKTSELVRSAYKLIEVQNTISFNSIIGDSEEIVRVKDMAYQIAGSNSTVLLRGESGTGKELFARAIHYTSNRNHFPFVAINCASIPENLLESELFGYEGGAFTGARKEGQMGKFELANGGTLFLDEIGDLPLHLQPKLLRVLQEQAFMRIGGKELITVNFRLIAATNRDLEKMVEEEQFRDDLYYRLNVIPINIPPLRNRGRDILILCDYLLEKYCCKLEKQKKVFSNEVKDAFLKYRWPGNIRELENAVEYSVNITKGETISIDNLPTTLKNSFNDCKTYASKSKRTLKDSVELYEKELLKSMLAEYGDSTQSKQEIADILDINLSTLYRKLIRYNLQK